MASLATANGVVSWARHRGPGAEERRNVSCGILGLTNPGIAIWDKANVEGKMTFPGLVERAKIWVPRMRAFGVDVVVVAAHSGATTSSSYGDALPYPENAATLVAQQVPGIDAILVGHAHLEIPERRVLNEATGREVVLTEPLRWGMRLSLIELSLVKVAGRWAGQSVGQACSTATPSPRTPREGAADGGPRHRRDVRQRGDRQLHRRHVMCYGPLRGHCGT